QEKRRKCEGREGISLAPSVRLFSDNGQPLQGFGAVGALVSLSRRLSSGRPFAGGWVVFGSLDFGWAFTGSFAGSIGSGCELDGSLDGRRLRVGRPGCPTSCGEPVRLGVFVIESR